MIDLQTSDWFSQASVRSNQGLVPLFEICCGSDLANNTPSVAGCYRPSQRSCEGWIGYPMEETDGVFFRTDTDARTSR